MSKLWVVEKKVGKEWVSTRYTTTDRDDAKPLLRSVEVEDPQGKYRVRKYTPALFG